MANPFDEFDAPASTTAKGSNPFDEFDDKEESTLGQKLIGGVEAAVSTAGGLANMSAEGLRALLERPFTNSMAEAMDRAKSSGDFFHYEPQTKEGKRQTGVVNDTMRDFQQEVADKFSGDVTYLNKQKEARGEKLTKADYDAENTERLIGEIIGGTYAPGHVGRAVGEEAARVKAPIADRAALDAIRKEPTLGEPPEAQPPLPPTGPMGTPPKLQPGQTQGELFGQAWEPYIDRRGQPDLFSDEVTYPPKTPEAIRSELRWMHQQQLEESRQAMATAFAQSHDDFVKRQLEATNAEAGRREDAATEQAAVQDRIRQANDQLIGDKLERADNTANNGEIRNAMGANDTLVAKLNDLEAKRGENPLYVDPQGQAFRGDPAEAIAARAGDMARDAINKEQNWMKGKGTPPAGEPLRPLTDVLDTRPDRVIDAETQRAIAAAGKTDGVTPQGPKGRPLSGNYKGKGQRGSVDVGAIMDGVRSLIPRGQRGGVKLDLLTLGLLPKKNAVRQIMTANKQGNFIPDKRTPEDFAAQLEKAKTEPDGKSFKLLDSGADLTSMKRRSTAIKLGDELIEGAFKRADLEIRNDVFPAEDAIRKLSGEQVQVLGDIVKAEELAGTRIAKDKLANLSPKMQNAYRVLREGLDQALVEQNEVRKLQGKPPITRREAYVSSRWQGDFRRPLFDKNGKVTWFLSGETKMGLDAQTRAVLKDHPDLTFDPKKDFVVRFWNRKTDMESAYTTMLDILGRDDPAVQKLQAYMEEMEKGNAGKFLNQEKHFKPKGVARGFIGDRPELTLNDFTDKNIPFGDKVVVANRAKHEAIAMFEQQMQYMKNAKRWTEIQKIMDQFAQLVNDPHLVEHQPNNVKYLKEYLKHALGYSESRFTRAMADSMRDFGISPEPFDRAVGGFKSYFILDKLAASIGFVSTQMLQLGMVLPHMIDLAWKGKFVGNWPKAISAGLLGGFTMGTGHQFNALGRSRGLHFDGVPGADFFNRAYKYAEDNGITARSIYDESPIGTSFSALGQTGKALSKTITTVETYTRSMAFMTLAQFLKDSGKFTSEADIFHEAERRTNVSMTNYAKTERPMLFAKLGTAGNMFNTLQTWAFNYYNQFSYFWREAKRGNVMPLLAALAIQQYLAGVMGAPYVDDTYKLLMWAKDHLPAKYWQKVQDNDFIREPKLWVIKNFGTSTAYGNLSDKLGINFSSRLAAPSGGQMLTSPIGPATEIAKQLWSVGNAIADPTNTTKRAQAAMDVMPEGVKGKLETSDMMEGHTYNKRPDGTTEVMRPTKMMQREGLVVRTPEDTKIRALGMRSMNETVQRDVNYATKRDEVASVEKAKDVLEAYYDAMRRGDKKDAKDMFKTYALITGKTITDEQFQQQANQEFLTDSERAVKAVQGGQPNMQQILAVARAKEIHDAIVKEHANGNKPTR